MAAIFLVPFYCCLKDERRITSINETFSKAVFLPVALVFTALFAVINLALVPFAYLMALYQKSRILCHLSKTKNTKVKDKKREEQVKVKSSG